MGELIEKAELISQINEMIRTCDPFKTLNLTPYDVIRIVESAPAVDPVAHAEWIEDICGCVTCQKCSAPCNVYDDYGEKQGFAYCPNCGAKMDKGGTAMPLKIINRSVDIKRDGSDVVVADNKQEYFRKPATPKTIEIARAIFTAIKYTETEDKP